MNTDAMLQQEPYDVEVSDLRSQGWAY
jgi:hypothetical protein